MSISLSVAQLCKHVLKIDVDVFEKRRERKMYDKSVAGTASKVWDNLEKIFPCSEQVVKENVSKTDMRNAVRSLLKGQKSVVLYTYSEERETRKGEKYSTTQSLLLNYK